MKVTLEIGTLVPIIYIVKKPKKNHHIRLIYYMQHYDHLSSYQQLSKAFYPECLLIHAHASENDVASFWFLLQ
jgi:hypothetical protein